MARRRFTDKDRARIFAANDGCCHLCGHKIDGVREAWEIEHVIAWELTRDDSDDNLRPAHIKCHREKTHKQDRPAINKAKRRQAKYTGATRSKQSIKSRNDLTKSARRESAGKPSLPPKRLYAAQEE